MDNNTKSSNKGWGIVVIILVVILVIVLIVRAMHKPAMTTSTGGDDTSMTGMTTGTDMTGDTTAPAGTEDTTTGDVNAGAAAASVSYTEALQDYGNARFQFDATCVATPTAETFSNGSIIMLDNRSATARTIHIGSMGDFAVAGYGFKLIKLNASGVLPNVMMIDCDGQQNVATVTVQK